MGPILYLIMAFIVFFFFYKHNEEKLKKELEYADGIFDIFFDSKLFAKGCIYSLLWVISLPATLLWKLLELIYNKFNTKK